MTRINEECPFPSVLLRREGDAVCGASALLPELHLHLQQHVPHAGEGGLHAGPDLQRLIVSNIHTLFLEPSRNE